MEKQFNDNGTAIIKVMGTEGTVETYDLDNCLDIWGRGVETKPFDAIEQAFDDVWHSGSVLDMGEFAHLITEKDVELYASDYAIEMEKLVPLYEIRDDLDTVSPWCLDRYLKTASKTSREKMAKRNAKQDSKQVARLLADEAEMQEDAR